MAVNRDRLNYGSRKFPEQALVFSKGDCVFCKKPIAPTDDSTKYGHDFYTKEQTWAHWDCYHEALNNPHDGGDR